MVAFVGPEEDALAPETVREGPEELGSWWLLGRHCSWLVPSMSHFSALYDDSTGTLSGESLPGPVPAPPAASWTGVTLGTCLELATAVQTAAGFCPGVLRLWL